MDPTYSCVEYYPESHGGPCGYCKSTKSAFSKGLSNDGISSQQQFGQDSNHSKSLTQNSVLEARQRKAASGKVRSGMWAYSLTVEDYQDLIDRGWRRSGQYCYKPTLNVTCCPLYTIKCDVANLKLSKSQKKILRRVAKYLNEGHGGGPCKNTNENDVDDDDNCSEPEPSGSNIFDAVINKIMEGKVGEEVPTLNEVDLPSKGEASDSRLVVEPPKESSIHQNINQERKIKEEESTVVDEEKRCLKNPRPGLGKDESKPACKKAKILRLEKKQRKLEQKGLDFDPLKRNVPKEKTIEDYINDSYKENSVNKLELRTVRSFPRSIEFDETIASEHRLYQKYQMAIHGDPITKCARDQFERFLVNSPLQIRLVPTKRVKESLRESWKLFVKYQTTIHKESLDECSFEVYKSFLVASPLQAPNNPPKTPYAYGSYHQQYWLNGKLIAVGVIDILPKCVSSVYFFYDPDYSFLSLGTYGSLRELEFVRTLHASVPEISSYYMGFYIHSCPKMRYKARLNPSYLLCPEVYTWHPVEPCLKKLDKAKYSRFNDDVDAVCEDSFVNLNYVLVLWNKVVMQYSSYRMRARSHNPNEDQEVQEYAELVGRTLSERLLLLR